MPLPVAPLVAPEVDPDADPDVLPEAPAVPELDIDGFSEEVVPVVERVVEPLMAALLLSELVEPTPAEVVADPPATTGGAMPLRTKTWHCAVVFHVFVAVSRHESRSCVLLGSYGSALVVVLPDITEFDEGIVEDGAAVLDLACDQAGAANATPTTAARADSLRECFMAVSLGFRGGATSPEPPTFVPGDAPFGPPAVRLHQECGHSHAKASALTTP
jgi:hypothetical protein